MVTFKTMADESTDNATREEPIVQPEPMHLEAYMEGLSRMERTIDDSGYAFSALDAVVKF